MKAFSLLAGLLFSLSALASGGSPAAGASNGYAHDGAEGNCQDLAQSAVDAIQKLNTGGKGKQLALVLLGSPDQIESYTTGGSNPMFKVTTSTGRGEGTCVVLSSGLQSRSLLEGKGGVDLVDYNAAARTKRWALRFYHLRAVIGCVLERAFD